MNDGKKFCSQCRSRRDDKGGGYILVNKGMNRRWLCACCMSRRDITGSVDPIEKEQTLAAGNFKHVA